MATWTSDSEASTHPDAPFVRVRIPAAIRLVMISVAISVPVTLVAGWILIQLAFHYCWGCGSTP